MGNISLYSNFRAKNRTSSERYESIVFSLFLGAEHMWSITHAVRLFRQKVWQSVWSVLHCVTPACLCWDLMQRISQYKQAQCKKSTRIWAHVQAPTNNLDFHGQRRARASVRLGRVMVCMWRVVKGRAQSGSAELERRARFNWTHMDSSHRSRGLSHHMRLVWNTEGVQTLNLHGPRHLHRGQEKNAL
jgi:hypothetical protein